MTEAEFVAAFAPRAKDQTLETLPAFLKELAEYEHDYGTICHAMALGAVATCWAIDKSPQGGITGFQGGAITWEFVRHWDPSLLGDCGARLLNYEHMLYPQYDHQFNTISAATWAEVQQRAAKNLAEVSDAHPNVIARWKSVCEGVIPAGYTVAE